MTDAIPNFKDEMGRAWNLRLTIGRARQILETCNLDFANLGDGKAFYQLCNDYAKLAQVLWILVESQAESQKVSPEQFAELLNGDTIEAAVTALSECVVRFTRRSMRTAVEKVIKTAMEAETAGMTTLVNWIEETGRTQILTRVSEQTEKAISQLMSGK